MVTGIDESENENGGESKRLNATWGRGREGKRGGNRNGDEAGTGTVTGRDLLRDAGWERGREWGQ